MVEIAKIKTENYHHPIDAALADYEQARQDFAFGYRSILREMNLGLAFVADCLGSTPTAVRHLIHSKDLRFSEMVALCEVLGATLRPIILTPSSLRVSASRRNSKAETTPAIERLIKRLSTNDLKQEEPDYEP